MMVAATLAEALKLGRGDEEDTFTGLSVPVEGGRIYGGQALGQAAAAVISTVGDDMPIHSLHGYFLRAGDVRQPVTYTVDRVRDGRSFSNRLVQASQGERRIFTASASFQTREEGVEHQDPPPTLSNLPHPDTLPERFPDPAGVAGHVTTIEDLMEVRDVPRDAVDGLIASWIRVRHPLGDDPAEHYAAIAYLSDAVVQDAILNRHGLEWGSPLATMASLDHAIWWYSAARADEWMLTVQGTPASKGGRALATGRLYGADGQLIAFITQEMLLRKKGALARQEAV